MTLLSDFVGVPSIDGVYWSLFVEIKFYLLISVLLAFNKIKNIESFLVLWLIVSAIAEAFELGKIRHLLITDYSAYFIAGATFYIIWTEGLTKTRTLLLTGALALACLTAIKLAKLLETIYPTHFSPLILCSIITLFFITFYFIATNKTTSFGALRWTALGALTYPLYLLHQMIGFMIFNVAYPAVNPHLLLWGTAALMVLVSYIIHKKIETPIAYSLKKFLTSSFILTRVK
jgi:peptidoglycan/LPS O-acetylase OafA/YrhL